METKKCCSECGRSTAKYKVVLLAEMVRAMHLVYVWCMENGRHEFTRKEIGHLLESETQTTNFGQLIYFGGILYKHGRGHWGMNMQRAKEFLNGEKAINTVYWRDPLTKSGDLSDEKFIADVPGIKEFLNDDRMYVPEYGPL